MRRILLPVAVAGVVALAGTVLAPGTAHAVSNFTCEGGFFNQASGTYNNVTVPSDANGSNFCYLNGANVLGNVSVRPGGAVFIVNSSIARNLSAPRAGTAAFGLFFSVAMCGTTVGRNVRVSGAPSLVEIGTDDYGNNCQGIIQPNTLDGRNNYITNNTGGVEVEGNQVSGNLTVSGNSGDLTNPLYNNRDFDAAPGTSTAVNNNSDSTHRLRCENNAGTVDSSGNSFATIIGQCNP